MVAAANLPSANTATAPFTGKTSLVAYDNLGNEVTLDVYSTKTAANTWEVTAFDHATAASAVAFPTRPVRWRARRSPSMRHGPAGGRQPHVVVVTIPNGDGYARHVADQPARCRLHGSQREQSTATRRARSTTSRSPTTASSIPCSRTASRWRTYRIPLADVPSPDNLEAARRQRLRGEPTSGDIQIGFARTAASARWSSGALEQSTVDLASELTTMIELERNYTANSKVFQTGADLMDVLVNLKR